jgi:hypothetical protein
VVFPVSDNLGAIRELASDASRVVIIVNPQWREAGQVGLGAAWSVLACGRPTLDWVCRAQHSVPLGNTRGRGSLAVPGSKAQIKRAYSAGSTCRALDWLRKGSRRNALVGRHLNPAGCRLRTATCAGALLQQLLQLSLWAAGPQVVSDFGIGPWRARAMEFLGTFEPSYTLAEQRVGAPGSVRARGASHLWLPNRVQTSCSGCQIAQILSCCVAVLSSIALQRGSRQGHVPC